MIKQRTVAFYVLVCLAIIAQSCSNSSNSKDQGKNTRGGAGIFVEAVIIKESPIQRIVQVPASILPNEQVELKAESSGKLIEMNLTEGSFVNKGDLLARINDSELRALLQKKQYDEKLAADDEMRKKRLIEINAISIQDYEAAQNKLDGIKAEIEQTKAQIAKAEIRAPFDGRIGLRYVSMGAYISTNTTLATLVQDNPLKIEFSVPERYSSYIKNGIKVLFTAGDSPTQYEAFIYASESAIDPNTRSLKVRAKYPNTNGKILPGSFAKVNIVFQNLPSAIMIPPQSIVPSMDKQTAFIVKNGKAMQKEISIGERTGTSTEVITGLSVGDTLVVTGLTSLKTGATLQVNIVDNVNETE
ncbi:MAG: efflux RND transporter periplasmic adaptor subunit [Bacteroidales bacterium]